MCWTRCHAGGGGGLEGPDRERRAVVRDTNPHGVGRVVPTVCVPETRCAGHPRRMTESRETVKYVLIPFSSRVLIPFSSRSVLARPTRPARDTWDNDPTSGPPPGDPAFIVSYLSPSPACFS